MILAGQHLAVLGAGFDPERRLDFPGAPLLFELRYVAFVTDFDAGEEPHESPDQAVYCGSVPLP